MLHTALKMHEIYASLLFYTANEQVGAGSLLCLPGSRATHHRTAQEIMAAAEKCPDETIRALEHDHKKHLSGY
jgi:hypothetical protein